MARRPQPRPIDPDQLEDVARAVIRADRFPHLATMDGDQPRVRPVSPVRTDGFTIYVANLRPYHKTAELEANPKVELCYLSPDHDQVRITGTAEVVTDRIVLQEIWDANPLLRHYLGTTDNPDLVVYRIVPARVRFMREWALQYHEVPLEAARSPERLGRERTLRPSTGRPPGTISRLQRCMMSTARALSLRRAPGMNDMI